MTVPVRFIVSAILLLFAWRGGVLDLKWPTSEKLRVNTPVLSDEAKEWVQPVAALLPKILPADRKYINHFYDAFGSIIESDGQNESPLIYDTERLRRLHAGSLQFAIEKNKVGKYPGLAEAIDSVFFSALGAEVRPITSEDRATAIEAANAIAYAMQVNDG